MYAKCGQAHESLLMLSNTHAKSTVGLIFNMQALEVLGLSCRMTRIATVPDLVPLLLFSSLGFHEVSSVENKTFRLRLAPTTTFFAEVFQATLGSLRLMLMVDFPIRCNRSRAYGRDSCSCVIAAPEKHPPRSDISPQGPIFCHSCGPFSIMMEMGESLFEFHLYYSAIHFGFRNITKPDTEQGSHHPLPAAKVLCLTALKRRPRPASLARFGYAL